MLFCLVFRWQPWHSRLHLPLFVLWSPVVGIALGRPTGRRAGLVAALVLALVAWSVPFLVMGSRRPLIGPQSILLTRREEQVFNDKPQMRLAYAGAAEFVLASGRKEVGLVIDDYEYPLWYELASLRGEGVRLEHVAVSNVSRALAYPPPDFRPNAVIVIAYSPYSPPLPLGSPWRARSSSAPGTVGAWRCSCPPGSSDRKPVRVGLPRVADGRTRLLHLDNQFRRRPLLR